jgi:shikimate dehydrogenase
MPETKIFAVAGNPIVHSKSPGVFKAAFAAENLDAEYTRLTAQEPGEILESVRKIGLSGVNITAPFKERIIPFLDEVDDGAKRVGAVNTIVVKKGKTHGLNTDVGGVRNALLRNGAALLRRKAIVLGSGGASRAAAFSLIREGARVVICNRTLEKAQRVALLLGCKAVGLRHIGAEIGNADILVSCLPPINARIVDPGLLTQSMIVLDATYAQETILARDARERGCKVIDGTEWLLFQGAASFTHFTKLDPPLEVMRREVYRQGQQEKKHIAFVGYMGVGKTAVAHLLAKALDRPLLDIDRMIEDKEGPISEIFAQKGEPAFRAMEKEEVAKIKNIPRSVISCGGGAVLDKEIVETLSKHCFIVWLWADIDTIVQRVGKNGNNTRPLFIGQDRHLTVEKMLASRIPHYASVADLIVRTDGLAIMEIMERIKNEIHTFFDH